MPPWKYFISCLILLYPLLLACPADTAMNEPAEPSTAEGRGKPAMTIGQAVILGLVEGLTEYLPVSSTGHLLIVERLLGIGNSASPSGENRQRAKDASDAYAICIQAGAIIAVLGLYFRRVGQMLAGLWGKNRAGLLLLINIVAGFLPAAVIGLLFNKIIKAYLFGPWPVVIAWFAGGLAIIALERRKGGNYLRTRAGMSLEQMTFRMALLIGFAQCVAMWPGVSRSLVTIVGGLLAGLSLSAAVEYSFLLGVATLGAATAYDALKHGRIMLETFDALPIAVGLVVAFAAAVVSIKWMTAYLNRHGLSVFGWYRVAIALLTSVLIVIQII